MTSKDYRNLNKMILRSGFFYRTSTHIVARKKKSKSKYAVKKKINNSFNYLKQLFIINSNVKSINDLCSICYKPYLSNQYKVSCKINKLNLHNFHPECLLACIDCNKYSKDGYFCVISNKFKFFYNNIFYCPYCLDVIELNNIFLKKIITNL